MPPCTVFQQKIGACAINDETGDPRQAIFPSRQLIACCTYEAAYAVLDCSCPRCCEHSATLNNRQSTHASAKFIIGNKHAPTLVRTFCLLAYIGCPQFIRNCINQQDLINDLSVGNRIDGFSLEDLHRNIWGHYTIRDPAQSLRLAKKFWWTKRQFFVPIIDDSPYDTYEKSDLLPFIEEQPLYTLGENGEEVQDHGAFGRVFSFRIIPEYDFLSPTPGCSYVRKELFMTSTSRFESERRNLELVKRLEDPHLVRLLKSYRHGNAFNFIFQKAKTNLFFYLRFAHFGALNSRASPLETSPLWRQTLGLARALSNVINYAPPKDGQPGQLLYGYHFDLKPANVLVEDNDNLLISDFGQARFQPMGDTSRITPVGGTASYAPPEIDTSAERFNRKYDVWSLGCMFLEMCAFIVAGHQGVKELDLARLTKSKHMTDDRFFHRMENNDYEVKPEVSQWIKSLLRSPNIHTRHSREFLLEILELIGHMLSTSISRRISAYSARGVLEGLLQRYQGPRANLGPEISSQTIFEAGDLEYAPTLTRKIQSMFYYDGEHWSPTGLSIVEDVHSDVYILPNSRPGNVRDKIASRSDLKIVPRYASLSRLQEGYSDCHLYFLDTGSAATGSHESIPTTRLFFQDWAECSLAHSAFIGQDILISLPLTQCHINKQVPFVRRFARSESSSEAGTAATIELWYENSHLHPSLPSRSPSHHLARQNVFFKPAPRRMVIYFEKSIVIVPFAKNVRLKHLEKHDEPRSVKIVPTEPHRDPSFKVSILKPAKGECAVGIPISSTHLEKEEDTQKSECKSIEISLESENDRTAFVRTYQKMKDRWMKEDKQIESYKKNMGPMLGYAPD
ncbi:kinase-like protein [Pyrenochaeta sp. DS3sAY3a]|nr:kinase-like protein [Pyrenochaeta sp. DS3sAY3a]